MAESSHSGKKRSRTDSEKEPDADSASFQSIRLENDLTFSDTSIALQMMRAQFPKLDKLLKKEAIVRVFKLNTGNDDNAIMFTDDYLIQMENAVKRLDVKDRELSEVFDWFKQYVIKSKTDVAISHLELCSLLSNGGDVTEKHVTLLINSGLLTRQLIDHNLYWFAIPNIGAILNGLSQYKEMVLANLEKKRLRLLLLDIRFHIRDHIGSGLLKTVRSSIGMLVRFSRD